MKLHHLGALAVVAALAAAAQPSAQTAPATSSCEGLTGRVFPAASIALPTKGFKITAAKQVAAADAAAPRLPTPAYCRVEGSILPVDPTAPPINFALGVPAQWNGGSWHLGGGGVNGFVPDVTGAGGPPTPGSSSLLSQGYAVLGSDSGHQGAGTDWVRNAESWKNFSYAQLKKTHDAADAVLTALNGHKAKRHYFVGGSQGGREGLEVISRYGADYDGVLSAVPLGYFQGLLIDPTIKAQSQTAPGAWIPPAKYPAINAAVKAACDGLDGLEDGVIGDVVACNAKLDPTVTGSALSALRCPDGQDRDSCLTAPQLAMLNSLHAPVKWPYVLPNGFSDWPGWAAGADTTLLARTQPEPAKGEGPFGIGAGVQRQLFGGAADYNLFKFDMVALRPKLEQVSRDLDVTPDWSTFFRHGGKLIWVTAGADTISNPRSQMRLFEEVTKRNGRAAVDASVRYYVLPMGDHGQSSRAIGGQPMPSTWYPLGVLRDWVERGLTPPDAPTVALYSGETITATRPICRYPAYPHYVGGNAKWASAFSCRKSAPT